MDGNDLARWTRFAAKGGIGKCTALQDCVAQGADDLMFLKDDEVVVLLQLQQEDQYLGYCEGVVGRFHGTAVRFHGKLKKPVFAKRRSSVGVSPSRPISLSPRSPSTNSPSSVSGATTKPPSSAASSPHAPAPAPAPDTKSAHPARASLPSISPSHRTRGPSHSRTASAASTSSHYSTHSRPPSRARPLPHHARSASTASAPSDSETQHVSLPAPAPSGATTATATPGLTDGASSAHSSFLLTPTPALAAFPLPSSKVPASLFQGRARSGSEKLSPREDTRDVRQRSGSETSVFLPRRGAWAAGEEDAIQEVVRPHVDVEELPTAASEASFQSVSVYSVESPSGARERRDARTRGVLQEDESEEERARAASVSGLSDLSDGGFGIGMTLLREDEDEDEDSDYGGTDEQDDEEETAIGHATASSKEAEAEEAHSPRTPRTPGMRVMNPNDSPSTSESEGDDAKDDTVMPSGTASTLASMSTTSTFPASTSSESPARPPLPSHESASSIASSQDEPWESDADIYDDYRYSRYSAHSPGPRRASRSSTKSGRSRASERPPLPDDDAHGTPPRKAPRAAGEDKGDLLAHSQWPTPPSDVPATPAASVTSPLTRAFRESDGSVYSRASEEPEEEETLEGAAEPARARARSPALASALREKIQGERRAKSPLQVLTARPADEEPAVVVLSESPVGRASPSPDAAHLRVASPPGSAPPSPLNPSYPPSPSAFAFAPTAPLSITKSPSPSPVPSPATPRHPISPPAIPFGGVPPPGRPPPHQPQLSPAYTGVPPAESLHSALRLAGQQRAHTIHGFVQTDLLAATGPVPISFVLPGMQPRPYAHLPPPPLQHRTASPTREVRSQPASPQARVAPLVQSHLESLQRARPVTAPAPVPGAKSLLAVASPAPSAPSSPDAYRTTHAAPEMPPPPPSPSPLPRANFFPTVGTARPRSRSFSGFNSSSSEITATIAQSLGKRSSQEEGSRPLVASSRPASPLSSKTLAPTQPLAPSPVMAPARGGKPAPAARQAHGPSPLSLPPTMSHSSPSTFLGLGAHSLVPPSPISASVRSLDIPDAHARRSTLHQAPSHVSLRQTQVTISAPSAVAFPPRRDSGPHQSLPHGDDAASLRPPSPLRSPAARQSHDSDRTHSSFSRSDVSTPPPAANGSASASSSPLVRSGSLRSKISISAMRAKGGAPRSVREGASETPSSMNGPVTPTDEETVQIKDMEFELVRPAIMRGSSDMHRTEDSPEHKLGMSIRTADLAQDSSSVRSEALSPGGLSPSDVRTHISPDAFPSTRKGKAVETSNSVQAHRDRELKWIATMNSGDAAQARKSKKIKKLLIDGVPSSVRYLVWGHLSNSASKKMPQVYAQLSKRRPAFARDIERDVEQSFPDHQHLRDPNGPLVSVLYAYIAMVPDLRYHRGLAIIAGNLLLQSPEEDAFWTFLALMDSHLRPYFMPTSPQMTVDTMLFVKAVEAADPQLAKRLFSELNVRSQDLCGVWFSSVFAGTLPLGHLHRVWDLFFYEGIPFLFRVGLTILSLSRRHLLESSTGSPPSYTAYLLCPPPDALPTDPEQFIAQVLSVKLKDDDIRKTRLKMTEAALKQQRAPRMSTSQPSHHLTPQGERVRAA